MKRNWIKKVPPQKWVIWIVIICIVSKAVAMLVLQSWQIESNFKFAYESGEIGAALAMGKGYSWLEEREHHHSKANEPTAWEAPVYPFIIAAVFKVFGVYTHLSAVILIIFQIIISGIICVILFLLGRYLFNEWVGVAAALLFTVNPIAVHFVVQKIYPTPLYVLLLLLFIFQILKLAERPSSKRGILAGFVCGIATLCAPFIIAFIPFAVSWLFFRLRGDLKLRILYTSLVLLSICVTISPWQIRNYVVFDRFILVRSNLGRELALSNYRRYIEDSDYKQLEMVGEGERSEIYEKVFFKSLVKDPGQFVRKVYRRVKAFWTAMPRMGGPHAARTGKLSEKILGVYFLFILIFGVIGLFMSWKKNRAIQLLFLALLSLPIPFYLTWFSRFRYRFPVEVILIIFSCYTLWYLWSFLKQRWARKSCQK